MENSYTIDELMEFKVRLRSFKQIKSQGVLQIVNLLKSAKITFQQLQVSKIGQTIKSLTKIEFEDEDEVETKLVNDACLELLHQWKSFASNERSNQIAAELKAQEDVKRTIEKQKAQQKLQLQKSNSSSKEKAPPAKPVETILEADFPIFDNPDLKNTLPIFKSTTRSKGLLAIFNRLTKHKEEMNVSEVQWIDLSVQIERSVLGRGQLASKYMANIRELLGMLSSEEIIIEVVSKLLLKEISLKDVVECKSDVFLTERKREEIYKAQLNALAVQDPQFYNNIRKKRLEGKEGEICRACKKKTAFLTKELQTRSADEPMTRFMECNSCGKSWRD